MSEDGDIEVGEVAGDGLRLFLVRTSREAADKAIEDQTKALDRIMSRAMSLTGWATASGTALSAAIMHSGSSSSFVVPAAGFMVSAALAASTLLPRSWTFGAEDSEWIRVAPYDTELAVTEAIAMRAEMAASANRKRLRWMHRSLSAALIVFILSGLLSLALAF